MKIISVYSLSIEAIKIIRFARYNDHRGYFTEHFRKSDFSAHLDMRFMKGIEFVQSNESYSVKTTVRGLHFQWNPYMGKLLRTLFGRMIDIILDIRIGSPTLGKAIMYDMSADRNNDFDEWIWVPAGFAHGNFFMEHTLIEYFCSAEYNQRSEVAISPLAHDIDWAMCDQQLKQVFDTIVPNTTLISEKDKNGLSVEGWIKDERSNNFIYGSF